MTPEEAYKLGQEHMKRRIAKRWTGWFTETLGGGHKMRLSQAGTTPWKVSHHSRGDVPILIRAMKVRPLATSDQEA